MDNGEFDRLQALFEGTDGVLFKPAEPRKKVTTDDRLLESFEQIVVFVRKNGKLPNSDADDLKEAGLGARLASIRADKSKVEILEKYDELGLLEAERAPESLEELFVNDSDIFAAANDLFDVSSLPKSKREVEHIGEVAERKVCKDFAQKYRQLFLEQQNLLKVGERKLLSFITIDQLQPNNFYVYDGMMCYVVEFGKAERKLGGYSQQRISVIFENGTESNMYKRSLAQRLYEGGMVVVDKDVEYENREQAVGYVYVLSSLSKDPSVVTVKDLHKIGVTTDTVERRIINAKNDPTYLMAEVKIVATYKLTGGYQPAKVESLIHRFFSDAKVNLEIIDSSGSAYTPEEWYSVPIAAIEEMVDRIADKTITGFYYDSETQQVRESID